MLKRVAKEFCLDTTLHGYRFIVLPRRTLLERCMWSIIVIVSIIATVILSTITWMKTHKEKVQTVTDSTNYPIWNYPFPAVTICNFNHISKKKASELIKHLKTPNSMNRDQLLTDLKLLAHLLPSDTANTHQWDLTRLQDVLDFNNLTAHKVFEEITTSCYEMLQNCKWKGEKLRCQILFETIKTEMGYCCAFNYFGLKNHTFQGALPKRAPKVPRRIASCGYRSALELVINNEPQDYFVSQFPSYGHRVFVHHPYDQPNLGIISTVVEMKSIIFTNINPTLTRCSKQAATLTIEDRNCLFNDEKKLYNFRHYSYHNCMIECTLMGVLRRCGCLPFFSHNENGDLENIRICNLRDSICLSSHRDLIYTSSMENKNSSIARGIPQYYNTEIKCNCLPDCEYCKYPVESSSGRFSRDYATNRHSLYGGMIIKNQSVIRIYFNDLNGVRNTINVVHRWHSLFALFGGMFSLFTGFSFGSAFELFYYCITIPLLRQWKKRVISS